MVLDIDGTVVVINANLWRGHRRRIALEFADVLDSIRIDPRALPNVPGTGRSSRGRTTSTRSTEHRRRGSSPPSTPGGRTWTHATGWHIAKGGIPDEGGIGLMTISNPVAVFSDACHPTDGFYPGSVATVDGFVTALREQQGGWVDVTAPSDISVDGYVGKAFQRTAPAVMSDCTTRDGEPKILRSRRLPELGERRRNQRGLRTGPDRDLVGPRHRRHGRRHQHGTVAGAIGDGSR